MPETPLSPKEQREAKIEEKIDAILQNPGEKRTREEIRKQAEKEVDQGIEVNPQ